MRMLGAEVIPVTIGTRTLKDAMNEAFRDWVTTVASTHYCIGSVGGPHPFPMMVRDFQRVIGVEARQQVLAAAGRLPDAVIACVGGGSNSIGIFHAFLPDSSVALIGCEAGGDGLDTGRHAATMVAGSDGVLHGMRTRVLQDPDGQTLTTHSISAGLDYPGVGPSTPGSPRAGGPATGPSPTPRPWRPFAAVPHRGHHPRAGVRACAGRRAAGGARVRPGCAAAGELVRPR